MIKISNIKQDLFLLSLFLYPLVFLNHALYLIPQFLLILILFFQNKKKDDYMAILLIFLFLSCFIPMLIELSSRNTLYDMVSKMLINLVTIIMLGYNNMILSERSRKGILYIVFVWLVLVLFAYTIAGFGNLSSLYYLLKTGGINSSDLYNAAEPISIIFLTKNITAMFVVAIFAFYVYLSDCLDRKIGYFEFLLFFITICAFLSRQAILAFLVMVFLYKFKTGGRYIKFSFSILSSLVIFWFVTSLINLDNSNDGASERVYLWKYFFSTVDQYLFWGLGFDGLNEFVQRVSEVGNFHMFFMNQIGLYGVFHFIFFNILLFLIYKKNNTTSKIYLIAAYILNVLFQTYGYEYGNLFLFMIMMMDVLKDKTSYKRMV